VGVTKGCIIYPAATELTVKWSKCSVESYDMADRAGDWADKQMKLVPDHRR